MVSKRPDEREGPGHAGDAGRAGRFFAFLRTLVPGRFVWLMFLMVALASIVPVRGVAVTPFDALTKAAIALLFYLHGAKLSRQAVIGGLLQWRLHLLVFASTFVLFPVLGYALRPVLEPWITPALYLGVLYLCMVPSTIQSSIVFTSIARGNIPAAVCSASISNIAGVFLTPALVGFFLLAGSGGLSLDAIGEIFLLLLLPFFVGQATQRFVGGFVRRHPALVRFFDEGSILLIVYSAFSAAVLDGLWQRTPLPVILHLVGACALILTVVLVINRWMAGALGFRKEDEIVAVFCGSKKSMASGIPMAQVIFGAQQLGTIALPLMIFHPIQLMVCAIIAEHYARRKDAAFTPDAPADRNGA